MQKISGEGTPPPRPHLARRLCLDLRAYGAQAQRDTPPPKKILVTALVAQGENILLSVAGSVCWLASEVGGWSVCFNE